MLTLVFFALMGTFFSMTQLLQLVYGYSPLGAALRLLPISVAMIIAAPRSAKLAARYGKAKVVASGMWLIGIGIGSARAGRSGQAVEPGRRQRIRHRANEIRRTGHEGEEARMIDVQRIQKRVVQRPPRLAITGLPPLRAILTARQTVSEAT